MLLRRHIGIIFLIHSVTVGMGLMLAWLLHFDFTLPNLGLLLSAAPILVVIRWAAMFCCNLTHGYWRHTGIGDLKDLLEAILLGSLGFLAFLRVLCGVDSFPLSIYILEAMLAFLLLAGLRVGTRIALQKRESRCSGAPIPVLIVGAGSAAVLLLQVLKAKNYLAIALVDDDPVKWETKLCGVPVLGPVDQLPVLVQRLAVREILIAIPSATGAQMLRITDFCGRAGVPFRAVPSLPDLVDGKVTISEFRDVNLDDLLRREPVRLESESVYARLCGRVVMVTGAAGSIGSELCKQIVRCQPKKLVCVDQAETPLFNLQQSMLSGSNVETVFLVTDITDTKQMRQQLMEHGVRVIFHAAAYKHVPMTEENPYEVLKNNVFGLLNFVETAQECHCEDFLLISSDKAVKPSSLMGCTKRLGEMIVSSRDPSRMRCLSVRFGNVLGSQGSVVPLFLEQIRTRRCVTVTHPEMTRYFMTTSEAVSLVLQAFTVGEHGNILVLDMGDPVRILDLAQTLIRMSGKEDQVGIVYSGMRPGEKLFEELFYDSEVRLPTVLPKVMRAETKLPGLLDLHRRLFELEMVANSRSGDLIRSKIKQIIPEYQWERPVATPLWPTVEMFPGRAGAEAFARAKVQAPIGMSSVPRALQTPIPAPEA